VDNIGHIQEVNSMTDLNSTMPGNSMMKLGFICVQNAGRSQMSAAFAERERRHREIEESVDIITGALPQPIVYMRRS